MKKKCLSLVFLIIPTIWLGCENIPEENAANETKEKMTGGQSKKKENPPPIINIINRFERNPNKDSRKTRSKQMKDKNKKRSSETEEPIKKRESEEKETKTCSNDHSQSNSAKNAPGANPSTNPAKDASGTNTATNSAKDASGANSSTNPAKDASDANPSANAAKDASRENPSANATKDPPRENPSANAAKNPSGANPSTNSAKDPSGANPSTNSAKDASGANPSTNSTTDATETLSSTNSTKDTQDPNSSSNSTKDAAGAKPSKKVEDIVFDLIYEKTNYHRIFMTVCLTSFLGMDNFDNCQQYTKECLDAVRKNPNADIKAAINADKENIKSLIRESNAAVETYQDAFLALEDAINSFSRLSCRLTLEEVQKIQLNFFQNYINKYGQEKSESMSKMLGKLLDHAVQLGFFGSTLTYD